MVVHAWSAGLPERGDAGPERCERGWRQGFDSARLLVQALGRRVASEALRFVVLASHLHDVTGAEATCPERLPVLGVCRVAPQEQSGLACLSVDVSLPPPVCSTIGRSIS